MKLLPLLLLLCAAVGTAPGQRPDPKPVPTQKQEGPGLRTEAISQAYCSPDNLRVHLRFTFVNSGSETLILYRYGPVISRYLVSKDLKSIAKEKYDYDVSPMLTVKIPPKVGQKLDDELFVVLKPGESFALERDVSLRINDGADSDSRLKPGRNYVMRLRVATWFTDLSLARELAQRWRETGKLWYFDVISEPMEFTIKTYNASDTCD